MKKDMFEVKVGNGYDVHAIVQGKKMKLGGVTVSEEMGFKAHSDGDVAIHALCDSLLGALALGDIGHLFPDTDDKWKGADSTNLLRIVVGEIEKRGWRVGNCDITIALQKPKIASFTEEMRNTLASILHVPATCVSVKATTAEKMGFVGRCEGCQCWATSLIFKKESYIDTPI